MADTVIDEKALQADVDEVKGRITDTKDLYKWVCALLFFRYGITPTTNRLYQLVRKGSMGTVTTALSTFWQDLREKSRIQIDHPGVPDNLKGAAGDLIQALWGKANVEAKTQFEAATAEANAKVAAAENALREAQSMVQALQSEVSVFRSRVDTAIAEKAAVVTTLEDERRAHSATKASLDAARTEAASLRQDLADARRDFASELEKARAAIGLAEERLEAAERRALAEIDRERTARAEADKLAQRLRADLAAAEQAANARIQALATENGELVGRLKAADADQVRRAQEMAQLRTAATDWESKAAHAEGRLVTMTERINELNLRDPIERAQDVTNATMKDFLKIVAEWKLDNTEQLVLLDARDPKRVKAWASGEQIMTSSSYQRVVLLRQIQRNLDIFQSGRLDSDWLRRPNASEAFKGKSAMDLMLHGQLSVVRDYLASSNAGGFS
jgi:DNA repair exonuclease SbcCD ATPase subunit